MFSKEDKLEIKRFYKVFIIVTEFVFFFYIVFCALYFGESVNKDYTGHYNKIRSVLTFIFLPIILLYLFMSIFGDPGDVRLENNRLYAYLYHLNVVLNKIGKNEGNLELESINLNCDKLSENTKLLSDLSLTIKDIQRELKKNKRNNTECFYQLIEKLSLQNKEVLQKTIEICEICKVYKLEKVHHCSYCEM